MGRPPKPPHEQQNVQVQVYVRADAADILLRKAEEEQRSVSDVVRELIYRELKIAS
ncbi:MAG TPA: ribbon-helix-helix protein, CopG family [Rhodothermales bacterium]|nr:ribbon-helix-helix protein, CopG family [Rhodothermales bacterium]